MAHSTRPTLPPLHTLDLPRGHTPPHIHELYDMDDMSPQSPSPNCQRRSSLYPTPPPSASPQTPSPPISCLHPLTNTSIPTPTTPSTPFPPLKVRLIPTSFENADAVVLVLPSSASNAPPPKPLLLVGPALARLRLRHPERQLAKGARIHPYRIVRPSDQRPPNGPSHSKVPC